MYRKADFMGEAALQHADETWVYAFGGGNADGDASMKNLLGGEGGFMIHATGQGKVVLSLYGALDRFQLDALDALDRNPARFENTMICLKRQMTT